IERNYGVILDFTMSDEYSFEEMAEAMQQDFYQNINFYLSMDYEINDKLSDGFLRDYHIYKMFRDPSVLLMNSNDMVLQYLIHQMNQFEGYETVRHKFLALDHDLIEVAKSYIEHNFNSSMAAKELYMHRNTFMNKLERFMLLTELNIKEFRHAMIAYVMIKSMEQQKH
ncbi:MAG: helix-turn-helix domain-containing protein, partial [Turicibacter sp.]